MGDMTEKQLGQAEDVKVDEFIRALLSQMFENDNDTSYLKAKLKATDGTESELEFSIRIAKINGIATRDEEDE